jgi:NADPH-dependent curcumin reductase CurA
MVRQYGDSRGVETLDKPKVADHEVLIKTAYASVNPVDFKIRKGYMTFGRRKRPLFQVGMSLESASWHLQVVDSAESVFSKYPAICPTHIPRQEKIDSPHWNVC